MEPETDDCEYFKEESRRILKGTKGVVEGFVLMMILLGVSAVGCLLSAMMALCTVEVFVFIIFYGVATVGCLIGAKIVVWTIYGISPPEWVCHNHPWYIPVPAFCTRAQAALWLIVYAALGALCSLLLTSGVRYFKGFFACVRRTVKR